MAALFHTITVLFHATANADSTHFCSVHIFALFFSALAVSDSMGPEKIPSS